MRVIPGGPQSVECAGYRSMLCEMEKSREGGIPCIHDDRVPKGLGNLGRLMRICESAHKEEDRGQLCLPKDMPFYAAEFTPEGSFSNRGTTSPRTWSI